MIANFFLMIDFVVPPLPCLQARKAMEKEDISILSESFGGKGASSAGVKNKKTSPFKCISALVALDIVFKVWF